MNLGTAISDTGLYMAALNALLGLQVVDEPQLLDAMRPAIATIQTTDEYWTEENGVRELDWPEHLESILGHVVTALATVDVEQSSLDRITEISFDGGEDIYLWLEETTAQQLGLEGWELDTGGTSDLYLVESFDGIPSMPNLRSLLLDAYGWSKKPRDARPLARLTKLTAIDLVRCELTHAESLLQLPALQHVKGASKLETSVRAALEAKGVVVE